MTELLFPAYLGACILFILIGAGLVFTFTRLKLNYPPTEQKSTGQADNDPNDHVNRVANSDQSPQEQTRTEGNQRAAKHATEQERLIQVGIGLNIITLAAALVGAFGLYVLYGTLIQTKNAADAAKQQADATLLAQRPWIGIYDADPSIVQLIPGAPVIIGVDYKNWGKLPTTSWLVYQIKPGPTPSYNDPSWWERHRTEVPTYPNCWKETDSRLAQQGIPMFPQGDNQFLSVRNAIDHQPVFNADEVAAINKSEKSLYIVGCISYTNTASLIPPIFHTDFCMVYSAAITNPQHNFGFCGIGNRID